MEANKEDFQWTDDLVAEFTSNRNVDQPQTMEFFKQSKKPKPEWEIIEFRNSYNYPIVKNTEGLWYLPNIKGDQPCSYADVLSSIGSGNRIHSVKRISDGVVFTLGDDIVGEKGGNIILRFHK